MRCLCFAIRHCYWDILLCSHTPASSPLGWGSPQLWNWKEDPHPSTWRGDSGTQQQAAATECLVRAKKLFPTNFSPFTQPYATYDAVLRKEKWDTQQQEQAPLAAHSLCLDAHIHTHSKTIECSPTLTHETEQLATKKHLHYRTLVDSQVLEPTLSLERSPLTNASFHREKSLFCVPPLSPMSAQTSLEPVAETAGRSESGQSWSQGGAAGERGGGTEGGMKQAIEGVAGLTILKPDLAFLKAGVRHQLPSFTLQRHEQSFLPERWPVHQKQAGKEKGKRKLEKKKNTCSRAGEDKRGEDLSFSSPFWWNLHRFQCWCCPLNTVAASDTEPGKIWQWREEREEEERGRGGRQREGGRKRTQRVIVPPGDTEVTSLWWQ